MQVRATSGVVDTAGVLERLAVAESYQDAASVQGIAAALLEALAAVSASYERITGEELEELETANATANANPNPNPVTDPEAEVSRRAANLERTRALEELERETSSAGDGEPANAKLEEELERVLEEGARQLNAVIYERDNLRARLADLEASEAKSLADIACEYGPDTPEERAERKEAAERAVYEERVKRGYISAETSSLFDYIQAQGGIKPSSEDLREEYREIPNVYRSQNGVPGDEMADLLATDRPELGIETEQDLLEFFARRRRQARHAAKA